MVALKDLIAMKKKELKLTNEDIASASGLHLSTINYLTSGKTVNPTLDTLQAIAPCLGFDLGDFNPDGIEFERPPMLIDSTGSMSRFFSLGADAMEVAWEYSMLDKYGQALIRLVVDAEHRRREEAGIPGSPLPHQEENAEQELIVYDEPAEGPRDDTDDGPHYVQKFQRNLLPSQVNFGVVIHGDSMMPPLPNGCIALVQATPALNNGEIGMFLLDGRYYCSQLKMDDRGVRLHALNPSFPDVEVLPYASFKTFGRVLGYYDMEQNTVVRV